MNAFKSSFDNVIVEIITHYSEYLNTVSGLDDELLMESLENYKVIHKLDKVKPKAKAAKPKGKSVPSAYILFSSDKREEAKETLAERTGDGKVINTDVMRMLGAMWTNADEETKTFYKEKREKLLAEKAEAKDDEDTDVDEPASPKKTKSKKEEVSTDVDTDVEEPASPKKTKSKKEEVSTDVDTDVDEPVSPKKKKPSPKKKPLSPRKKSDVDWDNLEDGDLDSIYFHGDKAGESDKYYNIDTKKNVKYTPSNSNKMCFHKETHLCSSNRDRLDSVVDQLETYLDM